MKIKHLFFILLLNPIIILAIEPRPLDQQLVELLQQVTDENEKEIFRIADELVVNGADVNGEIWPPNKSVVEHCTWTMLQRMSRAKNVCSIRWLIAHKANLDQITALAPEPPLTLLIAPLLGTARIEMLIQAGASINVKKKNCENAPILQAIFNRNADAVRLLLSEEKTHQKIDLSVLTYEKRNPLEYAQFKYEQPQSFIEKSQSALIVELLETYIEAQDARESVSI